MFDRSVKQQVLNRIKEPDYRNLFYMGHGAEDRFGNTSDPDKVEERHFTSADYLFKSEIEQVLENSPSSRSKHPYRFVYLNACGTAAGTICEAFGIPRKKWLAQDFARRGLRARGFVGSVAPESSSALGTDPGGNPDSEAFKAAEKQCHRFLLDWRAGARLSDILVTAKTGDGALDPGFRIHGATDLRRTSL
jgi:hypothetical protein